jgi:two-component system, chemotaxis family, CheB/CheR fusion protein
MLSGSDGDAADTPVADLAAAGARSRQHGSLRGMRLLVVDDDPGARELLDAVLRDAGAEVVLASSAAEALCEVEAAPFDMLLCDIGMPGEDGYSVIRKVRALGLGVPAIALTAYSGADYSRQALESGYQVHLAKPVSPDRLLEVIASLHCG